MKVEKNPKRSWHLQHPTLDTPEQMSENNRRLADKTKLESLFIKFEINNISQLLNFEIAQFMFLFQKNNLL